MDNSTAKTLEALAAFVEQQRAVLAQTQSALDQLRRLRSQAAVVPPTDVDQLAEQLNGTAFRLGEQATESLSTPENIDWDVFAHKDPRPLVSLGTTARTAYTQRNVPPPPPSQQKPTPTTLTPVPVPPRSSLQHLVRSAKVRLLDPIFALYGEEDPPAHAKHQTHGTGPVRGPSGLFARREPPRPPPPPSSHADNDREDAISLIGSGSTTVIDSPSPACHSPPSSSPLQLKPPHKRMKFDYPIKEDVEPMDDVPIALAKPVRARRISTKLARQNDERSEEVGRGRRKVVGAAANSTAAQRVGSPVIHKDPPSTATIPAPSPTPAAPPRRSTRVSLSLSTANSAPAPAPTPAVIPVAASPPKPKLVIRLPARSARPLASEPESDEDEGEEDEDEEEEEDGSETERGSMTSELSSVGGSSDEDGEDDDNREDDDEGEDGEEELEDPDSDEEVEVPRVLGKRKRRRGSSPSSTSSLSPPPRKRGRPRKGEMTARDRARRERDRLRKRAKREREREEREEERREKKARGKATYKVMWSAEEQNHLERLLEEVPASDPRRYLKISVAMGGKRTPRQVSSRVQKYLQKLKKFGIEAPGAVVGVVVKEEVKSKRESRGGRR